MPVKPGLGEMYDAHLVGSHKDSLKEKGKRKIPISFVNRRIRGIYPVLASSTNVNIPLHGAFCILLKHQWYQQSQGDTPIIDNKLTHMSQGLNGFVRLNSRTPLPP